jgi:hypothetical protein
MAKSQPLKKGGTRSDSVRGMKIWSPLTKKMGEAFLMPPRMMTMAQTTMLKPSIMRAMMSSRDQPRRRRRLKSHRLLAVVQR